MAQIFLHFGDRDLSPILISNLKEIFNLIPSFLRIVHKHCQNSLTNNDFCPFFFVKSPANSIQRQCRWLDYKVQITADLLLGHDVHVTAEVPIFSLATTFTLRPISSLATTFTLRPIFSLTMTFTLRPIFFLTTTVTFALQPIFFLATKFTSQLIS